MTKDNAKCNDSHWFTSYSGEDSSPNNLTVSKKELNVEDLDPLVKELTIQKNTDAVMITRYKMHTNYLPPGASLSLMPDENGTLVKWDDVSLLRKTSFTVLSDDNIIRITNNNGHVVIEGVLKSLKINGIDFHAIPFKENEIPIVEFHPDEIHVTFPYGTKYVYAVDDANAMKGKTWQQLKEYLVGREFRRMTTKDGKEWKKDGDKWVKKK